jgi:tetratricopeptide (TPR) repeat protein
MIVALLPAFLFLQTANLSASQQDLVSLEREATELVKRQPSAINWQKLALSHYLQSRHKEAIDGFGQALHKDPSLWTSRLFLGISLYRTNQFPAALAALERVDREAPKQGQGRDDIEYWMGATQIALLKPIQGLQTLERLLARNPKHSEALQLATETYAETATGLWNRVAERAFETAEGQEVHGYALESEGNRQGAIEAFARSLALSPRRVGPGSAIARLLLSAGDLSPARTAIEKELQNDPSSPEGNFYAGLLALREGRAAEAIKPLQTATAWMPKNEEPALALCQAFLALGKGKEAVAAAKHAVNAEGRSVASHELLVAALTAVGDQAEVELELQRWEKQKDRR